MSKIQPFNNKKYLWAFDLCNIKLIYLSQNNTLQKMKDQYWRMHLSTDKRLNLYNSRSTPLEINSIPDTLWPSSLDNLTTLSMLSPSSSTSNSFFQAPSSTISPKWTQYIMCYTEAFSTNKLTKSSIRWLIPSSAACFISMIVISNN